MHLASRLMAATKTEYNNTNYVKGIANGKNWKDTRLNWWWLKLFKWNRTEYAAVFFFCPFCWFHWLDREIVCAPFLPLSHGSCTFVDIELNDLASLVHIINFFQFNKLSFRSRWRKCLRRFAGSLLLFRIFHSFIALCLLAFADSLHFPFARLFSNLLIILRARFAFAWAQHSQSYTRVAAHTHTLWLILIICDFLWFPFIQFYSFHRPFSWFQLAYHILHWRTSQHPPSSIPNTDEWMSRIIEWLNEEK